MYVGYRGGTQKAIEFKSIVMHRKTGKPLLTVILNTEVEAIWQEENSPDTMTVIALKSGRTITVGHTLDETADALGGS